MPKFCTTCGKEVNEDAVVCMHCGCAVAGTNAPKNKVQISMVLGILGLVFCWLFPVGLVAAFAGIIVGIIEYRKNDALIGLLLSIVGVILSFLALVLVGF